MIPLTLWLLAPKLRADAEAPPSDEMRPASGPCVDLGERYWRAPVTCRACGDAGVLYHSGVSTPEPCPERCWERA